MEENELNLTASTTNALNSGVEKIKKGITGEGNGEDLGERAKQATAEGLKSAASSLRDQGQAAEKGLKTFAGTVANVAQTAADKTEAAGKALRELKLREVRAKAGDVIRRYPVQTLGIGLAVGFFVGRRLHK